MHLAYLRQQALDELRKAVGPNLPLYSKPDSWLAAFFERRNFLAESKIEIERLPELQNGDEYDLKNAISLHVALHDLTPSQAADERLWTWLAHGPYWNYMRARWPVDGQNNPEKYIREHYFLGDARSLVRHGVARLWWFGHATCQPGMSDPYRLTKFLLKTSDARQQIMERQFWRNRPVLAAMLERIGYWEGNGLDFYVPRERFRRLCKTLNLFGGTMLLDSLSPPEVHDLIDKVAQSETSSSESV